MMTHLQMDQDKPAQGQNSSGNSGLQNGVSNVPAVNPPMISPAASPTNVSFKLKLVNFDQKYQFFENYRVFIINPFIKYSLK